MVSNNLKKIYIYTNNKNTLYNMWYTVVNAKLIRSARNYMTYLLLIPLLLVILIMILYVYCCNRRQLKSKSV